MSNPFATGRLERLLVFEPCLIGTSWEAIEQRWERLGPRVAVVGHHGSGKTTFLDAMAARLRKQAGVDRLFFNDRHPGMGAAEWAMVRRCEGRFLLMDGVEQLAWKERRELDRASRMARGVIVARHRRSRLPTLLHLKSSEALAEELLDRISPAWRRALGGDLASSLKHADGNLRELWMSLYDEAAGESRV